MLRVSIRMLLAASLIIGSGVAFAAAAAASTPITPRLALVRATDTSVVLRVDELFDDGSSVFTISASPGPVVVDNVTSGDVTISGLTPDTSYTLTAIATTSAGTSPVSTPLTVSTTTAPAPIPGPPTNLQFNLGGGPQLNVTWDPPEQGADLVTGYEVTAVELGDWAIFTEPADGTSFSFNANHGQQYTILVRCLYDDGGTQRSDAVSGVPPDVPAPQIPSSPTLSSVSVDRTSAVLHIDPSASDGGLPITGYTLDGVIGTSTPSIYAPADVELDNLPTGDVTVTGLQPRTVYTFDVTARNAYYNSTASRTLTFQTAGPGVNEPGAPTNLQISLSPGRQVNLTWDPPAINAELAEGYQVSAHFFGITSTIKVTGTSFSFTGQPGVVYAMSVQAVYAGGAQFGAPVSAAAPVIPADYPPTAPDLSVTRVGLTSAVLHLDPPSDDGGLPITGYTVTGTPGPIELDNQTTGDVIVTGLNPDTDYTFTATASSAFHVSPASGPAVLHTAPGAPTGLQTSVDGQQLDVGWDPPAWAPDLLEGYRVTASAAGQPDVSTVVTGTSVVLSGLTPGVSYAVGVQGVYNQGTEYTSELAGAAPIIPVPPTVPDAPGLVLVAGGSGQVQLGLTAPAADGGMPVTGYTIVDSLHGITQSAVAGVNTVSGLTNGVTYDFNAVAINGVGPSTVSTAVTVTPAGAPTAPRLRPVVKWYTLQAVVTAPADSGGRPITGYTATLSRTGMVTKTVNLTAAGTATFTGLTPRTGYHVQVVARNAVGTSAAAAVNVTTSALPAPIPIPRTPTAMTGGESQILSGLGLFPTGSATPTAAARGHLAVLARELGAATVISCAGYTDSAGSPLANYLVALARAHAVCAVLRTDGVRATESMVSYGQTHPVATGRNQPANSRVVVMFVR